jgi:hypothetical protein
MELASACHLDRARSSGSQGSSSLPPPRPPTHSTSGLFLRTSTCRGGKRSVSCHHRACSRMPPWSLPQDVILCRARSSGSQGSSLPPLPLPTHSTSVTLLENLYLSMRRDACVSSSSRLPTDASMELASACHLDRARSSGSKCPSPPPAHTRHLRDCPMRTSTCR